MSTDPAPSTRFSRPPSNAGLKMEIADRESGLLSRLKRLVGRRPLSEVHDELASPAWKRPGL